MTDIEIRPEWIEKAAQVGATMTRTDRFAGRAATNTLYYGHTDAAVTAGGTGAPTLAATTVGANGAGVTTFVKIAETAAPVTSAVFDTVVSLGAWSKYGAAATTEAGLGDADDTTGVISSTAGNDPLVLALAAGRLAYKMAAATPGLRSLRLDALHALQIDLKREQAEAFGAWLVKQGKPDDVSREWPIQSPPPGWTPEELPNHEVREQVPA